MEIKIAKTEYLWGYAGYFYKYGMRFLTLPFVWHYLDKAELDIWYVFLSISMFVGMLDFGFSPNVSRAITYAFSGAKELKKEGVSNELLPGGPNYVLLAALISTSKKIYGLIAGCALLGLLSAGTWYLWKVSPRFVESGFTFEKILPIWLFFVFATCTDIYFKHLGALVGGRGLVGITQKFDIIASWIGIVLNFLVLYFGYGLLGTVVVSFLMTVSTRVFFGYVILKKIGPDFQTKLEEARRVPEKPIVFRKLWHNSWKLGVNNLGTFLIFQIPVLLSGVYFEKSHISTVGITLQVFNMVCVVAGAWFNMSFPRYANLYAQKRMEVLRREFLQAMLLGATLYVTGFLVILFLGNPILHFFGKDKLLLPGTVAILLYGGVFLSEMIHGKSAVFIAVKNVVPYVPASLITGGASVALSLFFVKVLGLGLEAFPLSMLCATLVYNSWYWPLYVIREFNFSWRDVRNVFSHAKAYAKIVRDTKQLPMG